MNIGIVASEAFPFAKTGGLADVAGALFKNFGEMEHKTYLFMPLYKITKSKFFDLKLQRNFKVKIGYNEVEGQILTKEVYPNSIAVFIKQNNYFDRDELYGVKGVDYADNAERFGFFDKAVLKAIDLLNLNLDVLHLNDWQTGLVPFFAKEKGISSKVIFTIHNLAYQGNFDVSILDTLNIDKSHYNMNELEFYGKVSFIKAGIVFADYITTVSPTYAKEILTTEFGERLEGILNTKKDRLFGILNGIDYETWDPAKDDQVFIKYDKTTLERKRENKKMLVKELGLKEYDYPLFGMVSRIVSQKGFDILIDSLNEFLSWKVNIVILGTGEKKYEDVLKNFEALYPNKIKIIIGFDEKIAHKIYAGSDFFLMPSKYEPCGLGQLIALRYGTLPIVHETGGLKDTIDNYNGYTRCGNGILFDEYNKEALKNAIERAIMLYEDGKNFNKLRNNAMNCNFSWESSAKRYIELFSKR